MRTIRKNKSTFMTASIAAAVVFAIAPVYAQDKTAEIDKIFSWAKPNEPGCAVAVLKDGKQLASRAYGSADLERGVPITAGGRVIGAIGCGGGTGEQDHQCAVAGAAAV